MDLKELRISDKKQAILNTMGIHCAEDLLTYYPFRYEEYERQPIETWQKDQRVVLEGVIVSPARVIRFKGRQSMTKMKIMYEEEEFDLSIFNRPWVSNFTIGKTITIVGKYDGAKRITALSYNFTPLEEQLGMHPVYNQKEGVSQRDIHTYIEKAWLALNDTIHDFIPLELRQKYRLIDRKSALYQIHHPTNKENLKQSLRHLKYEEFLKFQLVMQGIKQQECTIASGLGKQFQMEDVMALKRILPFTLTKDQNQVIQEILRDLASDTLMYRMVQGDVGCGKTMVAAFGMYACVLAHKQAAFMAPTEILAKQHAQNLKSLFQDFEVHVEVLYSSLTTIEKKEVLKRLKNNEIDILVGTHALFQEGVEFYDLGMVVADEQHRFGVEQRKRLLEKGEKVDSLLMSATPIPRTLALSLYGDMEVSTIQELPKGRMPIQTKWIKSKSMSSILEEVLEKIDEGEQCYVVCPAIEKNEEYEMRNVNEIYEGMKHSLGKKYTIDLLHGKMNSAKKDEVMEAFLKGKTQILVSTTVIEVGVDVKNANIIVLYDAHRFGLSQIHQLRGRVGRGERCGYCYLLSDTKDVDSRARLQKCVECLDGFEIARADLELRGPGDILGTRQSGVPGFLLGDVVKDSTMLEVARKDAQELIHKIDEEGYEELKSYLSLALTSGTYFN